MLDFLRARIRERSTWGDVVMAIAAGAVLPTPYSYAAILCGVVKALIPDNPQKE